MFLVNRYEGFARNLTPSYALFPEGSKSLYVPSSVAVYEKDGSGKWLDVAGILPVGTQIRFKEMHVENNPEMGVVVSLRGWIISGDYKGPNLVELEDISNGTQVNIELLGLVQLGNSEVVR
jgi:hypothetical protein